MSDTSTPAYTTIRAKRRSIGMRLGSDGVFVVRAPMRLPQAAIDTWVATKAEWMQRVLSQAPRQSARLSKEAQKAQRKLAEQVFPKRYQELQPLFAYTRYPTLRLRSMRTRWGSCSSRGYITLNTRLVDYGPESLDYVILHELCHVAHPNHGPGFYRLFDSVCPRHREYRKRLTALARGMDTD